MKDIIKRFKEDRMLCITTMPIFVKCRNKEHGDLETRIPKGATVIVYKDRNGRLAIPSLTVIHMRGVYDYSQGNEEHVRTVAKETDVKPFEVLPFDIEYGDGGFAVTYATGWQEFYKNDGSLIKEQRGSR